MDSIQEQHPAVKKGLAKGRTLSEDADALVEKDHQRRPTVGVGSAWMMQQDQLTIKSGVDQQTLAINIKSE